MQTIFFDNKELTVDEAFQQALDFLGKANFLDVAKICREIVAVQQDHFRAHHGIGLGLHRAGNTPAALEHFYRAIEINPGYFEAYNNLGNIMRESGNFNEALQLFLKGKTIRPETAIIHYNIGTALRDLDRCTEAIISYKEALRLDPCYTDAGYGLAISLQKLGRKEEAEAEYQEILRRDPNHADALYGFAILLNEIEKPKEAYNLFQRLISLRPEMYDAHLALGNLLSDQVNFGMDWAREEALECYRHASALKPDNYDMHITVGNLLVARGEIDEALERFRLAQSIKPYDQIARSCILMTSQYHPVPTLKELYEESILWPLFSTANIPRTTGHHNRRDPDRSIRIGYVSADLRMHPVGFYLLPVLYHHTAEQYEVFCYSNSKESDIFTERLRSYADNWRAVVDLNDEELHELIINDGIDILVDLSGHTGGNRLPLFARKPAPVQATWIGFFFTTGLKEIDYILMDETAVQRGEERFFSETVIRLPQTRFCYEPPKVAPEVATLPALKNGYVTFGSFNNLAKVTPAVIHAWGSILKSVPNSHLILKSHSLGSDTVKERITRQFIEEGVSPERLTLRGVSPHVEMLAEYGDMDIALDPFPFNGGLTSCEALWMGVPVLTMIGNRPIARQTAGFLKTIGLEGFIGSDVRECCDLAVTWSRNLLGLEEVRQGLRKRMTSSLLCDGKRFTANLEEAYREMWQKWCESDQ